MIIVTGGAGFIGWHLCNYLLSWDKKVLCVDDLRASVVDRLELAALESANHNFKFWCRADHEIEQRLRSSDDIEAIFHLASPVGPVGVLEEAGSIASQIIRGAHAVADVAMDWRCRLIFVSTSEVYGGSEFAIPETKACIFQPGNSARKEYALGKLAAEVMLQNMQPDLDVVIIRPFNVAGPRQNAAKGFVIPRFVEQALDGEPLTVFGDGEDKRALTHVLDVVDGLWAAYLRGQPGEVYNLGNPNNVITMNDLAARVANHPVLKENATVANVDPRVLFPGYVGAPDKFPDADKAWTELEWLPSRPINQIIGDAFQWEVTKRGVQS